MRGAGRIAAAAVAAAAVVACSSGGNHAPGTITTGGTYLVTDVADAAVSLPDGAADALDYGSRLSIADVTGDGIADLIVGAPGADGPVEGRTDAGAVYVVSGDHLRHEMKLPDDAIFTVHGAQSGDNLGFAVATGDLNGDGTADLIAGATGSNSLENLRTDMGEAFVFFGGPGLTGERDLLESEQDFLLQPAEGFSHLGTSFAVGDINGDGMDDLVAGAPYAGRPVGSPVGSPRTTVGEVYVVFGSRNMGRIARVADSDEDVLLSGTREFDQFGASLAVSDVDGDGIGDIIVGSPGYEPVDGPEDAGAVFVFGGRTSYPARIDATGADFAAFSDSAGAGLGDSLAVRDEGGGRVSVLAGAPNASIGETAGSGVIVEMRVGDSDVTVNVGGASIQGAAAGDFLPASMTAEIASKVVVASPTAGEAGVLYVVVLDGAGVKLAAPPRDTTIIQGRPAERLGVAMAAGDLDGDGVAEIAVMAGVAPGETRSDAGTVYVLSP